MMERNFIAEKLKEFRIGEFISQSLSKVGHSHTVMKKTPLGEKIIIYASKPGLIVGKRGANIKDLTKQLKKEFNLENPQIEISEVENIYLDAGIVAEKIAASLERFGINRFKGVGHKMMEKVMEAGALGIELLMSGKIPGARARTWRFYQGYLRKCGNVAITSIRKAHRPALLKSGIVGIQVKIMPPNIILPDEIRIRTEEEIGEAKAVEEKAATEEKEKEQTEEKKTKKKKTARKKAAKKEEKTEEKVITEEKAEETKEEAEVLEK